MAAPFTASAAFLGNPVFGLIHINPLEVANAFQTYLVTASKLTGVSLDDISTSVIRAPNGGASPTLVDLLDVGMKLFDAVVWLTAGRPTSHPLQIDPGMARDKIPSMHDIARAVFYCYFLLITQARYPVGEHVEPKPKIPNFLISIMGMERPQHEYVRKICSFEPQKFDPAWARYVQFAGFGQEVLSRFGLGVAGYRMFGPFKLYSTKPNLTTAQQNAVTFARTVANAPATWAIHPLTRDPAVLTIRGNLNKNLGNLILEVFTEEQIAEMVRAKVIFGTPVHEPTHRNYTQWGPNDDISGTSRIF